MPQKPSYVSPGLCKGGFHCCNKEMEDKLTALADLNYNRFMLKHMSPLRQLLITQTRLHDYLITMIKDSLQLFEKLFTATYGLMFNKNKSIFIKFYDDLLLYYEGKYPKKKSISRLIDDFYHDMYILVLGLLKPNLILDEQAKMCIKGTFYAFKPFGEYSESIKMRLIKSFTVTRTFTQSLFVGRDVINAFVKKPISQSCRKLYRSLTQCNVCRNQISIKPCYNYCMDTMDHCLTDEYRLENIWKPFIGGLLNSCTELMNRSNMEETLKVLPLSISNLIMSFQTIPLKRIDDMVNGCNIKSREVIKRSIPFDTSDLDKIPVMSSGGSGKNPSLSGLKPYLSKLHNMLEIYQRPWIPYAALHCKTMAALSPKDNASQTYINAHKCYNKHGTLVKGNNSERGYKIVDSERMQPSTDKLFKQLKEATIYLKMSHGVINTNINIPPFYSMATTNHKDRGVQAGSRHTGNTQGSGGDDVVTRIDDEDIRGETSGSGSGSGEYAVTRGPTREPLPPYTVLPPTDEPDASTRPLAATATLLAALTAYLLLAVC